MAYLRGTGLACALGADVDACVRTLRAGQRNAAPISIEGFAESIAPNYYRIDDGAALFDPGRLARLLPSIVASALDAAALTGAQRRAMPVFVGSSCFSIVQSEADYASTLANNPADAVPLPHVGFQTIADIARKTAGSDAPDFTFNTACTSSANALLAAQRMLAQGQIEHALVLGVELANLTSITGFSALQLLSDRVRPFDARRTGIVLGEAIGAAVLSVEAGTAGAVRLRGGAANCDTHSVTTANPDGRVLATVQRDALRICGVQAEEICVIKAHATGTSANDLGEVRGMRLVHTPLPPVTAFKPYLGHTLGACGVAELALFSGALRHGFIPATVGFETIDPELDLRPLEDEMPAAAGLFQLNHFGFGGNNAVLILETR
ncbi:MAG TPA: beta-ketoacyl synthase N-terminal-like domain-containing protein [Gammaproteobacteria bacterium]|nr:beta-ketoacyl synthase N-terminal-like domain-containing protein [Gammaproteobacteria bacterium]